MRKIMIATAAALMALTTSACAYMDSDEEQRVEDEAGAVAGTPAGGSGETTTRSYAASGFSGIVAAGSDKVEVTRGDAFAVTATGDPEVLDRLIIQMKGKNLEIRRRSGTWSGTGSATIRVTMPALDEVTVAGSGDVTADRLSGDSVDVTVAGSGNVRFAAVEVRKLEMTIAGSGKVEASGTVEEIEATIAGSGDIVAPALTATRAEISIAGSGNIAMAVTGNAEVSTIGSGNVTLTGGATCTHDKMGGGEVTCS